MLPCVTGNSELQKVGKRVRRLVRRFRNDSTPAQAKCTLSWGPHHARSTGEPLYAEFTNNIKVKLLEIKNGLW